MLPSVMAGGVGYIPRFSREKAHGHSALDTGKGGGNTETALHSQKLMKTRFAGLLLALFCLLSATGAETGKMRPLFDGKTFKGWEGDTNKTFRIENGAIVGGSLSAPVPRNEFLCTTRQYTNFVLRVKFKLLGGEKANAGIQIRTQRIPNHHEVSGYQADMGQIYWGCLYDESRRKKVLVQADTEAVKKVIKHDDWTEYVIRCEGKRIQLTLNGLKTVDYTETEAGIDDFGIIAVQIHGGPASEAWYKEIMIEELP
jgi:hypothetical protein